ncbi:hypothetical protein KI387_000968, partial [Taxus chinensis]
VEETITNGHGREIEVLKANFGFITKELDHVRAIVYSYMEWSVVIMKLNLQHLQTLRQLTNAYYVVDSQGRKRKVTHDGFDMGTLAGSIDALVKEWAK